MRKVGDLLALYLQKSLMQNTQTDVDITSNPLQNSFLDDLKRDCNC